MPPPRFSCSLSTLTTSEAAVAEALRRLDSGMGGGAYDMVVVFATAHHDRILETLGRRIAAETGAALVVGCTCGGVIGEASEVERGPGLALWGCAAGGSGALRLVHVRARATGDAARPFEIDGLPPAIDAEHSTVILIADPFTFPTQAFLDEVEARHPGLPVIGGMASGGSAPGQNRLLTAAGAEREGALALVVSGALDVRPVVSQGCRPVGTPLVITDAKQNLLRTIGGKPALVALQGVLENLPSDDAALFRSGPFLGLAVDANKRSFQRADFLVRGILGVDPKSGAIAVADSGLRKGTTVQFLVRDAASASEDLRETMRERGGSPVRESGSAGALVFSCNGRGARMFGRANHDVERVRDSLGAPVATAGFFAMGEIGPVGDRNFLHGFTASVALFRERNE